MNNNIGKEYNFLGLLKFAFPSMVMMVFMSLYTMVDGIFVSRFVGTDALSAVNIVYPVYNVLIAIGVMLATGGSALIAKKMGEGQYEEGRENFTLLIVTGGVIGIVFSILGFIFINPMLHGLGANENLYPLCYDYGKTFLYFTPFVIIQLVFQLFYVTAGKPTLGLIMTVVGGVINIVLDYLFIVTFDLGIMGAALATGIGIVVPSVFGIIYFALNRRGTLYLVKPKMDWSVLLKSCSNGASEMVSNVALAVVTILYNIIMMRLIGEDGVAAITIILYVQFFISAVFMGYSMGIAPIISYNYGSENIEQGKKIFKYSVKFIGVTSIISVILSWITAPLIITIFAMKGTNVFNIAMEGFKIFSLSFLFGGINIFASSLFTAYSNGRVSAIISFLRTFVFIVVGLLTFTYLFGVNGVWTSMAVAEILTLIVSVYYVRKFNKEYSFY